MEDLVVEGQRQLPIVIEARRDGADRVPAPEVTIAVQRLDPRSEAVAFGVTAWVALEASGLDVCFEAFFGLRAAFMQRVAQQVVVEWSLYPPTP